MTPQQPTKQASTTLWGLLIAAIAIVGFGTTFILTVERDKAKQLVACTMSSHCQNGATK